MELTLSYVLSQVFIILNYVLLVVTYQVNKRKTILILNILSTTFAGISYVFLHAYTGIAMSVVSVLRNIFFMIDEHFHGEKKKIDLDNICMLLLIYLISVILAIITYDGLLSLLSVLATMLYTYSVWQKSTKIYKWLGIPVCMVWLSYNIYIKSLFGIILEMVLMISAIIGLIREKNNNS